MHQAHRLTLLAALQTANSNVEACTLCSFDYQNLSVWASRYGFFQKP